MIPNQFTETITAERSRTVRNATLDSARDSTTVQGHTVSVGDPPDNQSGYWDGDNFVTYFTLGKSLLGGTDLLK